MQCVLSAETRSMCGIHTRQQKNIFIVAQVYLPPHCSSSLRAQSDRDDTTIGLSRTTEFLRSRFPHRPGSWWNKATSRSLMDVARVLFSVAYC